MSAIREPAFLRGKHVVQPVRHSLPGQGGDRPHRGIGERGRNLFHEFPAPGLAQEVGLADQDPVGFLELFPDDVRGAAMHPQPFSVEHTGRPLRVGQDGEWSGNELLPKPFLQGLQDRPGQVRAASYRLGEKHVGTGLVAHFPGGPDQSLEIATEAAAGDLHNAQSLPGEKTGVDQVGGLVVRDETNPLPSGDQDPGRVPQQSRLPRPEEPPDEDDPDVFPGDDDSAPGK